MRPALRPHGRQARVCCDNAAPIVTVLGGLITHRPEVSRSWVCHFHLEASGLWATESSGYLHTTQSLLRTQRWTHAGYHQSARISAGKQTRVKSGQNHTWRKSSASCGREAVATTSKTIIKRDLHNVVFWSVYFVSHRFVCTIHGTCTLQITAGRFKRNFTGASLKFEASLSMRHALRHSIPKSTQRIH